MTVTDLFKGKIFWYETRNRQKIVPMTPARYRDRRGEPISDIQNKGTVYQWCQILPPVPQRFEWINLANIVRREA